MDPQHLRWNESLGGVWVLGRTGLGVLWSWRNATADDSVHERITPRNLDAQERSASERDDGQMPSARRRRAGASRRNSQVWWKSGRGSMLGRSRKHQQGIVPKPSGI